MTRCLMVAVVALLCSFGTPALAIDGKRIGDVTGLPVEVTDGVAKVTKPRGDVEAVVDGRPLKPFQGLTSWAAFEDAGREAVMMGDVVLLEHEVNAALSAALEGGLDVTALHNHFFYDTPRVYFMHIGGTGRAESLARAVRGVLEAAGRQINCEPGLVPQRG